jgi:hypothetical protein
MMPSGVKITDRVNWIFQTKLKQEKVVIQRMDELVFVQLRERNDYIYAHPLYNNDPAINKAPSNYMKTKGLLVGGFRCKEKRKKKGQLSFFWYQVVHKRLIALVRKQN